MNVIINFLKGIAIGAGAIIPGVSSGVICVILGIYEDLLDSVLNIFKNFKENIKFLLPILIGILIGMTILGKILHYLLFAYQDLTSFTFIGLILGSIPTLIKQVEDKEKFRLSYLFYLFVALLSGLLMVLLERNINITDSSEFSIYYLFLAGMCMSIGVVIPGVSSTVILMLFGVYRIYLLAISNVYLSILLPIGLGLFIGSLICMKIIRVLLDKYYKQTFYSIIGFSLGSVFVLYPGLTLDINGFNCILCFIFGWLISSIFEKNN